MKVYWFPFDNRLFCSFQGQIPGAGPREPLSAGGSHEVENILKVSTTFCVKNWRTPKFHVAISTCMGLTRISRFFLKINTMHSEMCFTVVMNLLLRMIGHRGHIESASSHRRNCIYKFSRQFVMSFSLSGYYSGYRNSRLFSLLLWNSGISIGNLEASFTVSQD